MRSAAQADASRRLGGLIVRFPEHAESPSFLKPAAQAPVASGWIVSVQFRPLRSVWAPKCERPIALGHHRYEWLYIYGFVEPTTGRTVWNVSNAVCKEMFEAVLADFAKSIGVGEIKRAVLQLDNAGWHGPENLVVPEGIRLVFQPSHSPELQPAEHLWAFVDEPLANTYFETIENLDKVVGERCVALMQQQDMISASTLFHWWPRQCVMK